jgi:hypothetical protein
VSCYPEPRANRTAPARCPDGLAWCTSPVNGTSPTPTSIDRTATAGREDGGVQQTRFGNRVFVGGGSGTGRGMTYQHHDWGRRLGCVQISGRNWARNQDGRKPSARAHLALSVRRWTRFARPSSPHSLRSRGRRVAPSGRAPSPASLRSAGRRHFASLVTSLRSWASTGNVLSVLAPSHPAPEHRPVSLQYFLSDSVDGIACSDQYAGGPRRRQSGPRKRTKHVAGPNPTPRHDQ